MTEIEEKLKLLERAFTTYAKRFGGMVCPDCLVGKLEIDPAVRYLMHYKIESNGKLSATPADGESTIMLFCRHCGYTKLLLVDCDLTRGCKEIDKSLTEKIKKANFEE